MNPVKKTQFVLFIVLLLVVILPAAYSGAVIYVDQDAPGPKHTGTSWTYAFTSLQSALTVASSGDEIWVAEGIYLPSLKHDGLVDSHKAFQMRYNVAIYGGFDPSSGITAFNQRDWVTYETILSGNIENAKIDTDNCYHVIYNPSSAGLTNTAILDGFIVTAGYADDTDGSHENHGAGMYNEGCFPTVRHCVFRNNTALGNGGGIYNTNMSAPIVEDCSFLQNTAVNGAGIYNEGLQANITDCSFSNNVATGDGGGICNEKPAFPNISDCTFDYNEAQYGGGIANDEADPHVSNCQFTDNIATWSGGAVHSVNFAEPDFSNCAFSSNHADRGGGAVSHWNHSDGALTECTFNRNTSNQNGGALVVYMDSAPVVTRCIFKNNQALTDYSDGGAVHCWLDASPRLLNCLFYTAPD